MVWHARGKISTPPVRQLRHQIADDLHEVIRHRKASPKSTPKKFQIDNSNVVDIISLYRKYIDSTNSKLNNIEASPYSFERNRLVISNAEIVDTLNIGDIDSISLEFLNCHFSEAVRFDDCNAKSLTLKSCVLRKGFSAQHAKFQKNLAIIDGTYIEGITDLSVVEIGGDLLITQSVLVWRQTDDITHTPSNRKRGCSCFCGGVRANSIILDQSEFHGRFFAGTGRVAAIFSARGCQFFSPAALAIMGDSPEFTLPAKPLMDIMTWADHIALDCPGIQIGGSFSVSERYHELIRSTQKVKVIGQLCLHTSHIGGDLDLAGLEVCSVFSLLEGEVLANFLQILSLRPSHFSAVYGSRCDVQGALYLDGRSIVHGQLRFNSSHIKGVVSLSTSQFHSLITSYADADFVSAVSAGDGNERQPWQFEWYANCLPRVPWLEAVLRERKLRTPLTRSISFDRSTLHAGVYMHDGLALGGLSFRNITINKNFEVRSGLILGMGHIEGALGLSGSEIGGHVLVVGQREAQDRKERIFNVDRAAHLDETTIRLIGKVRIRGARIKGNLHLTRGRFFVDSLLWNPIGEVDASTQSLFHSAEEREGRRKVVELSNSTIRGITFFAEGEDEDFSRLYGDLDLGGVNTRELCDARLSWPTNKRPYWNAAISNNRPPHIVLDGLAYQALSAPLSGPNRVDWLLRQRKQDRKRREKSPHTSGFRTQPWEQAATILRSMGYHRDADYVAMKHQRYLRSWGRLPLQQRLYNSLLGLTVGHGYAPWYAVVWATLLTLLGSIVFDYAWQAQRMIPAQEEILFDLKDEGMGKLYCDIPMYPRFNALLYSLDVIVPILDLKQETYWLPARSVGVYEGSASSWYDNILGQRNLALDCDAETAIDATKESSSEDRLNLATAIGFQDLKSMSSLLLRDIIEKIQNETNFYVPVGWLLIALSISIQSFSTYIYQVTSNLWRYHESGLKFFTTLLYEIVIPVALSLMAYVIFCSVSRTYVGVIVALVAVLLFRLMVIRFRQFKEEGGRAFLGFFRNLRQWVSMNWSITAIVGLFLQTLFLWVWLYYFFNTEIVHGFLAQLDETVIFIFDSPLPQTWMIFQMVMGWTLVSAVIAGVSAAMRRK